MGEERCEGCDRTVEQASDEGIEWELDSKYCDKCLGKMQEFWEKEHAALYRDWERERF